MLEIDPDNPKALNGKDYSRYNLIIMKRPKNFRLNPLKTVYGGLYPKTARASCLTNIMRPTRITTILQIDSNYAEASNGIRLSQERAESSG
jgi:hypothetical protein